MQLRQICVAIAFLVIARPTYGQLVFLGQTPGLGNTLGNDIAYDPVHDRYLAVSPLPSIRGTFLDPQGAAVGSTPTLGVSDATFPETRVAYSADVSDGAGGQGGFVIVWFKHRQVFAQVVSFTGTVVGAPVLIATAPSDRARFIHVDVAYSPVDRVFLVPLVSAVWGDAGLGTFTTTMVRLDSSAHLIDQFSLSAPPHAICGRFESEHECPVASVVWNPVSGEFGVAYPQGNAKTLARVRGDGLVLSRTNLGIGMHLGAVAVNTTTGAYLAVGNSVSFDEGAYGAEVDPAGRLMARGLITRDFATASFSYGHMALSYQPVSGTFLLGGSYLPSGRIVELSQHGVALSSTLLPTLSPVIASHPVARQWIVAVGNQTSVFGTATPFGGSDAPLGGCASRDPFVTIGGGTCVNGGWTPRGLIGAPVVAPGACVARDPFVSLGGGVCVNGRWTLPPRTTPPPTGCVTPKPGANWVCVNRGWVPPSVPPTIPPPPVCTIPDPFVSIGGGVCINGGWVPRRDH